MYKDTSREPFVNVPDVSDSMLSKCGVQSLSGSAVASQPAGADDRLATGRLRAGRAQRKSAVELADTTITITIAVCHNRRLTRTGTNGGSSEICTDDACGMSGSRHLSAVPINVAVTSEKKIQP